MSRTPTAVPRWPERLELAPAPEVRDEEFCRLLGYPAERELSDRADELMRETRAWFATHGRPWLSWREVELEDSADALRIDGLLVRSPRLRAQWRRQRVERAVAVLVCAGAAVAEQAGRRWEEEKPDEYFFLETFGSAVVEALLAQAAGTICAHAEAEGWTAVPRYSPGFAGCDVAEQVELFSLARGAAAEGWPEPVEVLASGMLRPKKSQFALIGLRRRQPGDDPDPVASPCAPCSLARCAYRRRPYRPAAVRSPASLLS